MRIGVSSLKLLYDVINRSLNIATLSRHWK
jgi:hypothetical protein